MEITEKNIQLVGHGSSKPSLKASMYTYCANRYKGTAYKTGVSQSTWNGIPDWLKEALSMTYSNGKVTWHKGLICVLDPVGRTDANAKLSHDKYKTIIGRNIYTNTSKRSCVYTAFTDGKYYSDCSSSVSTTHKMTINSKIGCLHTPGMITSSYYKKVDGITVKAGHITSGIEKLRTSMALMFAGSDWGRLKYFIVGHTEMVYGLSDGSLLLDSSSTTTTTTTTPVSTAFTAYKVNVTASDHLNIRKEPSTSSDILGYLKRDHEVTIRSEKDGWGKVICYPDNLKEKKAVTGWISLKYTKKS